MLSNFYVIIQLVWGIINKQIEIRKEIITKVIFDLYKIGYFLIRKKTKSLDIIVRNLNIRIKQLKLLIKN